MKKIEWFKLKRIEVYEGMVDGEKAFVISGLTNKPIWVQDFRNGGNKTYTITSLSNGKRIAKDLLNNLNHETHEKNRLKWQAFQDRSTKVIEETDKLLKKLNKK